MRARRPLPLLAASLVAVAVVACAPRGGSLTDEQLATADVVVTADRMAFVDPPTTLPAGSTTIALVNNDGAPHDLTVEGGEVIVEVGRDGQALGELDLDPGTYTIYCSVPGHRDAGMVFDVTVG